LKIGSIITVGLLSAILVNASCFPVHDFDSRLASLVKPHTFSIVRWELTTIPHEINEWVFGNRGEVEANNEVNTVIQYFSSVQQIRTLKSHIEAIDSGNGQGNSALLKAELARLQQQKAALAVTVERIIGRQIRESFTQQGIFNPVLKLDVSFPPINFTLDKPPHLLVVSPRDRIETMREITLKPTIGLGEMEQIENQVNQLGVSSLVVELGGFGGTYPSFVGDNGSLRFTIETAVEEWLHQYLVFKPLGFLYLLDTTGVARNYEIATINETVAGMVSQEIGSMVYARYYQHYENGANQSQGRDTEFDFNREMRQIRRAVDEYLARGEIGVAENFMEEKRQFLASKGYHIRKLNQAYFAFYGTYADSPTSISPIGLELKQLREQSVSVKGFLDQVAGMTGREDLQKALDETGTDSGGSG
jgi:hypothetical protein